MKVNLLRIGFLFILFGLAIAGATVASDSINWAGPVESVEISGFGQQVFTFYPIRRTVRLTVESSTDFQGELHILDEARIKRWLEEGDFDPLGSIVIHGGLSTVFQPSQRGFYAFVVENDLNATRQVSFRFTEYGYEYDLFIASSISFTIGSTIILIWTLVRTFGVKRQNM